MSSFEKKTKKAILHEKPFFSHGRLSQLFEARKRPDSKENAPFVSFSKKQKNHFQKKKFEFPSKKKKKKFPRTREWNEVEFSSPFPVSKGVHSLLWRERNWR